MSAGFFRGTNIEQDNRFGNAQQKLLNKIKFPEEFKEKVDTTKVNMDVIKPWISNKITEVLGLEDDVVMEYVFSMLEEKTPDPRKLQINLGGFLESKAPEFTLELWKLLLSAQKGTGGIPEEFIEAKKEELRRKQIEEERINEAIRSRRDRHYGDRRTRERSPRREFSRERRYRSRERRGRRRDYDRSHRSRSREYRRDDEYRPSRRERRGYDDESDDDSRERGRERRSERRHHHRRRRSPSSSPVRDRRSDGRQVRTPSSS